MENSLQTVSLWSLIAAIAFVFTGNLLGKLIPVLNRFAMPGAILGGALGIALGPQLIDADWVRAPGGTGGAVLYDQFAEFPGLFINVVFACLMLGRRLDSLPDIWARARQQVVMGHVFAWGQYVVGLALASFVLAPVFGIDTLAGPVIAIGFQGGHGTAAGLSASFEQLGFPDGRAFAMALATAGIVTGVVLGPLLANYFRGRAAANQELDARGEPEEEDGYYEVPRLLKPNPLTSRLTVHLGLVLIVIAAGYAVLEGIRWAEGMLRGSVSETLVSSYLPLFSVVLIVGMAIQALLQRVGWHVLFDRSVLEKISAFSLDMVIFGALATLPLGVINQHWLPITLICITGISWNCLVLFLLGPRVYREPWFAFALGDFGGGTATTATGIMLIKVVDPDNRTGALSSYAAKQPFYEPLMGGGIVTALALPTVALLGPLPALGITTSILGAWLFLAFRVMRQS